MGGLVGLTYALSQGLVAKPLVHRTAERPSLLVLSCIFVLGSARPFALWTSSLQVIYVLYVLMVIALGVMNTASSKLADKAQLGGFFGVMESVENVAGMVGPALGGLLAQAGQHATLGAVIGCYAAAAALVSLCFTHVTNPSRSAPAHA